MRNGLSLLECNKKENKLLQRKEGKRKKLTQFGPEIPQIFILTLTFYNTGIKLPAEVHLKGLWAKFLILSFTQSLYLLLKQ